MSTGFTFAPLIPVWLIIVLTVLGIAAASFGSWRGLKSLILRALASFILCGALLNPQKVLEARVPLPDIAVIVTDQSESMQIAGRAAQAQQAESDLIATLRARGNIEIVRTPVLPNPNGTRLADALVAALSEQPENRLSGIFVISDGQVHDLPANADSLLPDGVPFHSLIAGNQADRDRRLRGLVLPKYGLVSEQAVFEIQIDDPGHEGETAQIVVRLNGEEKTRFTATVGSTISLPLTIERRGPNMVEIETGAVEGELTARNNRLVAEISGVRDRLRVLLITGEPHMGGRAWRNLLKSDPSVDMVHFTILTNPGPKQPNARSSELSLIAFPEAELFEEKLNEFDLIIFDQFRRRKTGRGGRARPMLRTYYISNIARYVEEGGALLVAAGPAFAAEDSLARSPLIAVLPAKPTGKTDTAAYRPALNENGRRHPITSVFAGEIAAAWGQWYRTIEANILGGKVLMDNGSGAPLLVVDKVGKGRSALLLSDQAWLWSRSQSGSGPYNELFRRLAHWLMGEPDLEAERLITRIEDGQLSISHFSLGNKAGSAKILFPDGQTQNLDLVAAGPGKFTGQLKADQTGAYRVSLQTQDGETLNAIAASGVLNPAEFNDMMATDVHLAPLSAARGGVVHQLWGGAGLPPLQEVKAMKASAGGDAQIVRREQYEVTDSRRAPFGPTWLYFLLILAALLGAWRMEGR